MKAVVLVAIGFTLGGLFMNAKLNTSCASKEKEEVVLGHRIAPNGTEILVVQR